MEMESAARLRSQSLDAALADSFPEVVYFRQLDVQDQLVDLLFIWTKLTPEIGYRQGMHELLALILWTVDHDSLPPAPQQGADGETLARLVLSRKYVEHDAWQLFSAVMKAAKTFYDSTPSVPLATSVGSASTTSLTLAHNRAQASSTAVVQPIVATAIRIHDGLLKTIDYEVWSRLEELGIEPQLWAIRWLRLLFSREFPIDDTLLLWDGIFAQDTTLRLAEFVCVAMLLRIRDAVIRADYSGVLQLLLRYPSAPDGTHHAIVLLEQAVYLRDNVSAEGGLRCRAQNAEFGTSAGMDVVDTDFDTVHRRRSTSHLPGHRASGGAGPSGASLLPEGALGDFAKGVYGRAEALGINKAFFGTLNEIRVSGKSPLILKPWGR